MPVADGEETSLVKIEHSWKILGTATPIEQIKNLHGASNIDRVPASSYPSMAGRLIPGTRSTAEASTTERKPMRSITYGKLLFALSAPWGPEDAATRCSKTLRNCGHFRSVACLEFRPWQHTWGFMRSSSSIWIGILIGSTIGGLFPDFGVMACSLTRQYC